MEMDIKAHHGTAGLFVHVNVLHIQRVHRKDLTMRFAFWRGRAAVAGFTEIGARLHCAFRQRRLARAGPLRQYPRIRR